jgi:hypothetical protein
MASCRLSSTTPTPDNVRPWNRKSREKSGKSGFFSRLDAESAFSWAKTLEFSEMWKKRNGREKSAVCVKRICSACISHSAQGWQAGCLAFRLSTTAKGNLFEQKTVS